MTTSETNPTTTDATRGSGMTPADVNKLMKQYQQMEKMMGKLSRGGMRELPIAVVDADRSGDSRLLARQIDASAGVAVASQPARLKPPRVRKSSLCTWLKI